jgi:thioredoxin reductase (NADPH)
VIVGSVDNRDVLRLEGFLVRNGHPHQLLDPKTDPGAQTLIERFHIDPRELPIVVCPNGDFLRNPSENQLARCIGLVKPKATGSVPALAGIVGVSAPASETTAVVKREGGISPVVP